MRKSERRKLWRRIAKIIPYVFVVIGIVIFFRECRNDDLLVRNFAVTQGRVTEVARDVKGSGGVITYEFVVGGKKYEKSRRYADFVSSEGYRFVGKSFPVVYDTLDVSNSRILIMKLHFERFKLPFPDSLEWVESYRRY